MGAGILLIDGPTERELAVPLGEGTNQQAELLALKVALETVAAGTPLQGCSVWCYTDSMYTVGLLAQGHTPSANRNLVNEVVRLSRRCGQFRIAYVPGHEGHALNERAHRLAVAAAKGRAADLGCTPSVSAELVEELEARVEALVKVTQFYADPLTYQKLNGAVPAIIGDRGEAARVVLRALGHPAVEEPFEEPVTAAEAAA